MSHDQAYEAFKTFQADQKIRENNRYKPRKSVEEFNEEMKIEGEVSKSRERTETNKPGESAFQISQVNPYFRASPTNKPIAASRN